ncbi:hypothetical protein ES703_62882 [subsurface metagenome]
MKPIIIDRTRLGQYADCPNQAYLTMLWDALKAGATWLEIFPWEADRIKDADPKLIESMNSVIMQSTDSRLCECGTEIHELLKRAFDECKNNLEIIPQWFVDNLPLIKPNIQPMAIRHARHAADMISEYHIDLIALEHQVSLVLYPETETTPAVVVTMKYDLIGSGKGNLHVMDWKTGFKRLTNQEAAESFQAEFGAWLLFQQEIYKEINTIHWWYFESMWGTKAYARFDRLEEHPRLPGLTTEKAIQGRVVSTVTSFIENCKDAWPLPYTCCWCDMIRFCLLANMDAKEIADGPKVFVDRMCVVEAWLRRQKAAATAWIKGKGPLEGTKVNWEPPEPKPPRFTPGFVDRQKPKGPAKTGDDDFDSHFK